MYTSKELSEWLKANGCELESEKHHVEIWGLRATGRKMKYGGNEMETFFTGEIRIVKSIYNDSKYRPIAPAYDILNDICVKYKYNFFGTEFVENGESSCNADVYHPINILLLLQQGKQQEEIEEYLWNVCLFNPKNK